ncbi:MAG: transglutaminase family protein [Xanthomonadales bacterium]|nr:transglutaminase family protein [Xanthomonadales bacterium]
MQIVIDHATTYRYDQPALRVHQVLRLWPFPGVGQVIRDWRVDIDGRRIRPTSRDGFGNPVATHVLDHPVQALTLHVRAEVETLDRHGVVGHTEDSLPPAYFVHPTALTTADEAIVTLAHGAARGADGEIARLHRLSAAVRARIAYRPQVTDVATPAAAALAAGAGVCQDHAHVLLAGARALGYPARYVSGYLCAGEQHAAASHAWVEIFVAELGWIGFDAANHICPDERYVRVATGRDYRDAAPVRGVRVGGGSEGLEVVVRVGDQ